MPSSLFKPRGQMPQQMPTSQRPGIDSVMDVIQLVKGNPQGVFNQLMQTNPQFREFYEQNKNKTAEQLLREYNVNPQLLKFLK